METPKSSSKPTQEAAHAARAQSRLAHLLSRDGAGAVRGTVRADAIPTGISKAPTQEANSSEEQNSRPLCLWKCFQGNYTS